MTVPSPGLSYAAERLGRLALPKLTITSPAPGIHFDRDVAVSVRDGTKLRLNVFRPDRHWRFPVTMCAHPYGKDVLPRRSPLGYLPSSARGSRCTSIPRLQSAFDARPSSTARSCPTSRNCDRGARRRPRLSVQIELVPAVIQKRAIQRVNPLGPPARSRVRARKRDGDLRDPRLRRRRPDGSARCKAEFERGRGFPGYQFVVDLRRWAVIEP